MALTKDNVVKTTAPSDAPTVHPFPNPDPTDPVDHQFDGAPVNSTEGRDPTPPESTPSPAGDVLTNPATGRAEDNSRDAKKNVTADGEVKDRKSSPENK